MNPKIADVLIIVGFIASIGALIWLTVIQIIGTDNENDTQKTPNIDNIVISDALMTGNENTIPYFTNEDGSRINAGLATLNAEGEVGCVNLRSQRANVSDTLFVGTDKTTLNADGGVQCVQANVSELFSVGTDKTTLNANGGVQCQSLVVVNALTHGDQTLPQGTDVGAIYTSGGSNNVGNFISFDPPSDWTDRISDNDRICGSPYRVSVWVQKYSPLLTPSALRLHICASFEVKENIGNPEYSKGTFKMNIGDYIPTPVPPVSQIRIDEGMLVIGTITNVGQVTAVPNVGAVVVRTTDPSGILNFTCETQSDCDIGSYVGFNLSVMIGLRNFTA